MFVQSGPGKTIINNFCGDGFQKVWRSCGTCNDEVSQNSKQRTVTITNSNFTGKGHVIASGNAPYNDKVSFNNVKIFGYKNRSTRVVYACGEVRPEIMDIVVPDLSKQGVKNQHMKKPCIGRWFKMETDEGKQHNI
uniref:pectate lyase n=1 Tax=Meloidogyne enterolobii TaxID=390850 RepID=A0A6V7WH26_MELEN|nr:unnamed protein product [Meloidogyne enterolobii]